MKTLQQSIVAIFILGTLSNAYAISAKEILAKADAVRMPKGDALVGVSLTSTQAGVVKNNAEYEVLLHGSEKTVIKTLAPATDRGISTLMLGRDLWAFLPDTSQPVRISLQQRLMGEVANGDLARANFQGDYTPTLASQGAKFYELKLMAVSDEVTYGQVRLWVEKGTFHPLRAAFYASSGRLLKVGYYKNYRSMDGVIRPTRLVFEDAVEKTKQSTLDYKSIKSASFPDKYFTKDYLKKLKY